MNKKAFIKYLLSQFKLIKKKNKVKKIALHEPSFSKFDEINLKKCIKTTFVSTFGYFNEELVKRLKIITKSRFVLPIINGTSALHLSLLALGIRQNTEVLMPSLNFIASPNSTLYINAIPHFVDVEEESFGIDPQKLKDYLSKVSIIRNNKCINKKTNRVISAIIVVHVFGFASKIEELKKIANKYKIKLIEDASEALGSIYKNKALGTFGDIGTISFNGNKIVTTGGGGAILTNSKKIYNEILKIYNTGKKSHRWDLIYERKAYNYKMPNINAALGCSQLSNLNLRVNKKRKIFLKYKKIFKNFEKLIEIKCEPKNCKSNYWLNTILLKKADLKFRNNIIKKLNDIKVFARPVWRLNHRLKYLSKYPKMNLDKSINLEKRIINIPSSSHLKI